MSSKFQRPGEKPQKTGRRFEEFWASLFGVKPIKGSGALWYAKLDVSDGGSILWSCKHTDDKSFRISTDLMHEVQEAILGQGGVGGETIPGIAVSVSGDVFVTLRAEDFISLFTQDRKWIPKSKSEEKRARSRVPSLLRDSDDE